MTHSLSVIMPVYNAGRYLDEALGSCLDQTHAPDEIVLVDDGSTDGSLQIAQSRAKNSPVSIRIHQMPQNGGEGAARATGMALAKGDILVWADADDVQYSTRFEHIHRHFVAHPESDICMNTGKLIDENSSPIDRSLHWPPDFARHPLLHELSRNYFLGGFSACRRDIGILFSKEHRYSPDYDFFLRTLLAGKRFHLISAPLTGYRVHGSNQSHNKQGMRDTVKKTLRCIEPERILETLKAQGCPESTILLHLGENFLVQEKPARAAEFLTQAGQYPDADHFKMNFYLATAFHMLSDKEKCFAALKEANQSKPDDPAALNNLATLHAAKGQIPIAKNLLESALRGKPNYLDARNNLQALTEGHGELAYTEKLLRESWFI